MQKKLIIAVIVLAAAIALFLGRPSLNTFPSVTILKPTPTPTPVPFVEMTIPYLRARQYSSTLGPMEKYSETGTYTSYLTSYTSDGLKIKGLLTIPKNGSDKHPAIVFVHGYIPPKTYRTTEKYVEYVDYLARNGFVVFKIDLRGHGDSEGEPGGGYYSSDYVIDTLNARAALASAPFVDNKKVGLWGHSMAGNVVMRSFAAAPEIPAVVIWAGAGYTYQDLVDYKIADASYQPLPSNANNSNKRRELLAKHGPFASDDAFWKQVAPTNYLNDLKGAIEINHATDDPVVSIKYSQNLMHLLDATSVPHEFYEYPTGGHNINGPSFVLAMQHTVEFYKKYLGNK